MFNRIEPNRCITLSKKKKSTTQNKDAASLTLAPITIENIDSLLNRHPLRDMEGNHQLTAKKQANDRLPFNFTIGANNAPRKFTVPEMPRNGGCFRDTRDGLPIYPYRQEILDAIAANQVVVISGETGTCHFYFKQ